MLSCDLRGELKRKFGLLKLKLKVTGLDLHMIRSSACSSRKSSKTGLIDL